MWFLCKKYNTQHHEANVYDNKIVERFHSGMVLIHSVCYNTCDLDKAWSADNGNRNGKDLVANCSLGIPSSLWVNTILKIPKKRISCCNVISLEFTNISVWKMAIFDFQELDRWISLCLCRWKTGIPTCLPDQSVPCQGKYIYAFSTCEPRVSHDTTLINTRSCLLFIRELTSHNGFHFNGISTCFTTLCSDTGSCGILHTAPASNLRMIFTRHCEPETHRLFNSLITNHAIRFSQRYDTFFLNDDLIKVMDAN